MMLKINACGPCGKPKGFSIRRPREANFLWEEGRDPAFHGKSAPEQGPQEHGSES